MGAASKKSRREAAIRRSHAYHEAGHAVLFTIFGFTVDHIRLERQHRDDDFGDALGSTQLKHPDHVTGIHLDPYCYLACTLAGIAAVKRLGYSLRIATEGSVGDWKAADNFILSTMPEVNLSEAARRGFDKAVDLLGYPEVWAAVERLAARLISSGRVEGPELLSIVQTHCGEMIQSLVFVAGEEQET